MTIDFKRIMSRCTDEELIRIVTVNRENYQPVALQAADDEMRLRGIDEARIANIAQQSQAEIKKKKTLDSHNAGKPARLVNYLIDLFAIYVLYCIYGFIASLFVFDKLVADILSGSNTMFMLFLIVPMFAIFIGYYIYMEAKFQKTLGKFVSKTTVVTLEGKKPSTGTIARRTFLRIIPVDAWFLVFTKNSLHDAFSDTRTIDDDKLREFKAELLGERDC